MEDQQIVQLFWDRDEQAIQAAAAKYGKYCTSIAQSILGNAEDAEECVNDTLLKAWNAIPPHKPGTLSTFLGKITRNLSFNKYRQSKARKRGGGALSSVLEELTECVACDDRVEEALEAKALTEAIDGFLGTLPKQKRDMFVCRYWYTDSISDIGKRFGMKEGAVSMTLGRIRSKLSDYLTERGF